MTSLRIIMVSSTFRCMEFSQRLVRLVYLPVNPSTRQAIDVGVRRKSVLYYVDVGRFNGGGRGLDWPDQPS